MRTAFANNTLQAAPRDAPRAAPLRKGMIVGEVEQSSGNHKMGRNSKIWLVKFDDAEDDDNLVQLAIRSC